jgi:hypothetical protein
MDFCYLFKLCLQLTFFIFSHHEMKRKINALLLNITKIINDVIKWDMTWE